MIESNTPYSYSISLVLSFAVLQFADANREMKVPLNNVFMFNELDTNALEIIPNREI